MSLGIGFIGGGGGGSESNLSSNVVYASKAGCYLDTDIDSGGGTDDTAALQAILNTAPSLFSLELVIEKPALVTGLNVYGNTTIRFLDGAGLYLADGSNRPIVRNANPTTSTIVDKNIALIGFNFNGNASNQSSLAEGEGDAFINGIAFYGIENLWLSGFKLHNCHQYAAGFSNWKNVLVNDFELQQGLGGGLDGIHFFKGSGLVVRDGHGQTGSDFVALNSSDYHDQGDTPWVVKDGDITDVLIDGIRFEASANGIGILAGTNLVDNITVRNLSGTVRDYAVSIWNAWSGSYEGGKIGRVLLDGIRVTPSGDSPASGSATSIVACYSLGGGANRIDEVQIKNVQWTSSDSRAWIVVDSNTTVGQMQIEGATGTIGSGNFITNAGTISELKVNHVSESIKASLLSNSGTITLQSGDAFSSGGGSSVSVLYSPLVSGDPGSPELVFDSTGDVIMCATAIL